MKTNINLILVLMSLCVAGIIGLQWFWNYQNYRSTVDTFQRDINESLNTAVDLEMKQRHQLLINQVKGWLADTSFIRITCDTKNRANNTVFYINDRYPKFAGSKGISFSINEFKPKLERITPEAKKVLIEHFGERTLRGDLQKGSIYYYTQRLGDSLTVAFFKSHVRLGALDRLYRDQLQSKGIRAEFSLNPTDSVRSAYLTRPVNASFHRPYKQEIVRAGFDSPDRYFLKTMKWVILTTLLLIAVCLLCFGYTVKTLLSQHKLARLKDDFINNMTHELNTPLSSIKITAEALKTFAYEPERQKEYLDIIGYQTEKLTDLTARILDTNRSVAASRQNWQPIDLTVLLDKAIKDMGIRFVNQQAIVTYEPPEEPIPIYGEAVSLITVFTNIIDNALKYASPDMRLTIRLVTINRWAEVVFADNGAGIPDEYRMKVFDPFFRVPQGNVHNVKGYGLGLNYVNQVLRQHRGSVTVQANEPIGSQFIIKLPLL